MSAAASTRTPEQDLEDIIRTQLCMGPDGYYTVDADTLKGTALEGQIIKIFKIIEKVTVQPYWCGVGSFHVPVEKELWNSRVRVVIRPNVDIEVLSISAAITLIKNWLDPSKYTMENERLTATNRKQVEAAVWGARTQLPPPGLGDTAATAAEPTTPQLPQEPTETTK